MKILDEHIIEKGTGLNEVKLSVFRKFIRREDLDDIVIILKENEIPFQAKEKEEVLDSIIIGETLTPRFWIEIENFNFSKVNELLEASAKENLKDVDIRDHYLNEMDDVELKEIILKPDEWNPDSVLMAKMILEKRGVVIDESKIEAEVKERYEKIKEPREINSIWIVFYGLIGLASGLTFAPLGIIVGLAMGFYYGFIKATAPDGERYYEFGEKTRRKGLIILGLTIVTALIGLFLKLYFSINFFNIILGAK